MHYHPNTDWPGQKKNKKKNEEAAAAAGEEEEDNTSVKKGLSFDFYHWSRTFLENYFRVFRGSGIKNRDVRVKQRRRRRRTG